MTERKVRYAKDVQDLWYLRGDMMAAIAGVAESRKLFAQIPGPVTAKSGYPFQRVLNYVFPD